MTLYTAGQKIRASELNQLPQMYFVTSDLTKNNSITLGNVTGLGFAAGVSSRYLIELFLFYRTNITADIRFAWSYPTGANARWGADGTEIGAGSSIGSNNHQSLSESGVHAFTGDNGVDAYCCPVAQFTTDATHPGTIQLQFAQYLANGSDTIVRSGSTMRVTQTA